MDNKQTNKSQLQLTSKNQPKPQNCLCKKIEVLLPINFVIDKHIDKCMVYKTHFCHKSYNHNTLINITGEFLLLYTDKNKVNQKIIFPFTSTFLCDFFPYEIEIPSPAKVDFIGQEINISSVIIISSTD
ncbi:MAG: hypothetical protein RR048_04630 [Oscillospiraceae bacterium]